MLHILAVTCFVIGILDDRSALVWFLLIIPASNLCFVITIVVAFISASRVFKNHNVIVTKVSDECTAVRLCYRREKSHEYGHAILCS